MIWDILERCPCTRYSYRYEVAQGARDRQRHFTLTRSSKSQRSNRDAKMARVYTQCGYSWCERGLPSVAPRRASPRRCRSFFHFRQVLNIFGRIDFNWDFIDFGGHRAIEAYGHNHCSTGEMKKKRYLPRSKSLQRLILLNFFHLKGKAVEVIFFQSVNHLHYLAVASICVGTD